MTHRLLLAAALVLGLLMLPLGAAAQPLPGSIYQVEGAAAYFFVSLSQTGTFVGGILTFDFGSGAPTWMAAIGATDSSGGTGFFLLPSAGYTATRHPTATFTFTVDAGNQTGTFSTTNAESFLAIRSGRFVRVFP